MNDLELSFETWEARYPSPKKVNLSKHGKAIQTPKSLKVTHSATKEQLNLFYIQLKPSIRIRV